MGAIREPANSANVPVGNGRRNCVGYLLQPHLTGAPRVDLDLGGQKVFIALALPDLQRLLAAGCTGIEA